MAEATLSVYTVPELFFLLYASVDVEAEYTDSFFNEAYTVTAAARAGGEGGGYPRRAAMSLSADGGFAINGEQIFSADVSDVKDANGIAAFAFAWEVNDGAGGWMPLSVGVTFVTVDDNHRREESGVRQNG